jgi:hypothetical protein
MFLRDLFESPLEEKQVWGRTGNKVVRKYRCSGGRRHGRVVSNMQQCFAPLDIKKSARFKRTKLRVGGRMSRKSKKTKRTNNASRRIQAMNKGK